MANYPALPTTLAEGGRIVIPAAFRKALNIHTGDKVILQLLDGELRLYSRAEALKRLQSRIRKPNISLAKQLIRERREQARRE